jgi:Ca-activated chloride channel family protein
MKRRAVGKYCLVSFLFLIALPCIAMAWPPGPSGTYRNQGDSHPNPVGEYAIRTNVDLVVLRATVRDHKGVPVAGLTKDAFKVYEDKVPQEIESFSNEDIPVTVGLVIDSSGSMRPKRFDVIAAAMAFVRSSNPQDQVFVVNFNEHVRMGLPANMPFSNNAVQLENALSRNAMSGMTALYDAITAALEQLQKGKWDKKVLIVVSDGGDNASAHTLAQVLSTVNQSNVAIYTMGIYDEEDEDRNPGVLRHISGASGGEAFFPETLKDILPICEQIARDIRSQYTISFVPTNNKHDGTYRTIKVKAREATGRRQLSVSTRAGYSAPANSHTPDNLQSNRP